MSSVWRHKTVYQRWRIGGAVEDCRRTICCTEKSVPSDRREALSGDVSTIRERLYWRLHVLPPEDTDLGHGPVGIARWSARRARLLSTI